MSLGAARAGFDVVLAADNDARALGAHSRNFPASQHLLKDLSTATGNELLAEAGLKRGSIDVVVGGPPCQGFSRIGKRNPNDVRNELVWHYGRIVREIGPRILVMENVVGLTDAKYSNVLQDVMTELRRDYHLFEPFQLAATTAGAPTTRTRVFLIGFKRDARNLAINFDMQLQSGAHSAPIVRDALHGLPFDVNPDWRKGKTKRKVNISKDGFFFESVKNRVPAGVGDPDAIEDCIERGLVTGCIGTQHSMELTKRYAALEYGEADPITKSVKLNPHGYCPTLRAGTGPANGSFQAVRPIHYQRPRVITPREAARLQGFPDWFLFDDTKWHSFRQIGNSVSPLVSEYILSKLFPLM